MNKFTLTATLGSVGLALAACGDAGDTTTTATEPAAETDSYESGDTGTMPPETVQDGDGTSLSVSPDGAQLEVEDGDTDVSVDTEDPSLEVDTNE